MMTKINIELVNVQNELNAPKSQFNNFGKYAYRSCEDILKSVKPLLLKNSSTIIITDEIVSCANRIYIKATAVFSSPSGEVSVSAFAREAESKKGMDDAQVTGSASSYARKYALNGLLLIDDSKDPDSRGNVESSAGSNVAINKNTTDKQKSEIIDIVDSFKDEYNFCENLDDLKELFLSAKRGLEKFNCAESLEAIKKITEIAKEKNKSFTNNMEKSNG